MNGAIDVKEVLLKMGYTIHLEDATHYRMRPLYRDSDNNTALEVDKSSGLWYDFVKRVGGPLEKLIELTMQLNPQQVVEFLENKTIANSVKDKYELEEIKQFDKTLLLKLTKNHSYWVGRGIKENTVALFEGGTTNNGRMKNRYVFPIFNERDDLVGFSGRNLGTIGPKWKILGKKTHFVYPRLKALYQQKIIIVESIGDMLSLMEIGIPHVLVAFGISISPKIIEFMLRYDTQKIIVALNNDENNNHVGNLATNDCQSILLKYFDSSQVKSLTLPYKDFNEFLISDRSGLINYCTQMELYV